MRRLSVLLGLTMAVFVLALPAQAEYQLIEFAYPFHAHELAGVVVDQTGMPVSGVVIEDCVQTFRQVRASSDAETPVFEERMILDCHVEPKHVLASTTTDSKGRFKFPQPKMGTTHYLYVTRNGFDPMQITVKIRWFAIRQLRIRISVAT
jgi:hypothetical protein